MTKKIGTLTLHWANNYGALLQCYALQTYISNLGYECKVIDYVSSEIEKENKLLHFNMSFLKDIIFFRKHFLRRMRSDKFRKKFISLTKTDYDCDIVVVGSDQIWNLKITHSDKTYFGIGIGKKSAPVISYAASMGHDLAEEYRNDFFMYLNNVSKISVREENAKTYINNSVDADVEVVLDPVFLLPYSEWINLIPRKKIIKKPYIFVYAVDDAKGEFVKVVNRISEALNLDVICAGRSIYFYKNYKRIIKTYGTLGPEFFLYYMFHSEFVVTSSFHGTVFSLVLKKQFVSVSPYHNASRLTNLLSKLDCSNRLISSVSEFTEKLLSEKIDYTVVSQRINTEKEKSENWLKDALKYAY